MYPVVIKISDVEPASAVQIDESWVLKLSISKRKWSSSVWIYTTCAISNITQRTELEEEVTRWVKDLDAVVGKVWNYNVAKAVKCNIPWTEKLSITRSTKLTELEEEVTRWVKDLDAMVVCICNKDVA